ncbi:MAG: hypothetical protein FWF91_06900 [Coriobacteriia bacterium]|nr:hypothetical protein [Coriobacteriia bacterium]
MNLLLLQLASAINPALFSVAFFLDDDDGGWIVLALLLAGPLFFSIMYARYRNSDKRHFHEKETPATISNLRKYDNYVKTLKRQNSKRISGANDQLVQGSIVNSKGLTAQITNMTSKQ